MIDVLVCLVFFLLGGLINLAGYWQGRRHERERIEWRSRR